jgi:hypothetical protein
MRRQTSTGTNQVVFTCTTNPEDEDKKMADGAVAPAAHRPAPKPAAKEDEKRTITITFGEKEAAVFDQIVKDADDADRTEAKYLAIWLRENYKK